MSVAKRCVLFLTIPALFGTGLAAQQSPSVQAVRIGPTAGYLTFGTYFTGPAGFPTTMPPMSVVDWSFRFGGISA
jgi:hypothetical protein